MQQPTTGTPKQQLTLLQPEQRENDYNNEGSIREPTRDKELEAMNKHDSVTRVQAS